MEWSKKENCMPLLGLLDQGVVIKNQANTPVADFLVELGWVTQTSRSKELALNDLGRKEIPPLLTRFWPQWLTEMEELKKEGCPLTAAGLVSWNRKVVAKRVLSGTLPPKLHKKSFAALMANHSKASVSEDILSLYPELTLTTDDTLRIRANRGLILKKIEGEAIFCDLFMETLGEAILPERACQKGIHFAGELPRAVMTVENLGAYIDLPVPPSLLVIYHPGWNSPLPLKLLENLPPGIPLHHFGDLDPKGVEILLHLKKSLEREIQPFIPGFWEEYLPSHCLSIKEEETPWPKIQESKTIHPMIEKLRKEQKWMEQEVIVVDSRLKEEVKTLVGKWKE